MSEPSSEFPEPGRRSFPGHLLLVAKGFCMGAADVVPGVSGGTMAFILGIYEELVQSIRHLVHGEVLGAFVKFRFREALAASNWKFLASVGVGILLAIVTLARGLEWLLENHPVFLWSFFFGLVLASVVVVAKRIPRWTMGIFATAVVGTVAAWFIVGMVPVQTPSTWWFFFLAGACAICAMILPGISGAFILLILGKYQEVLAAVNDRELLIIAWVGAGAAIGIVSFAQVLGWLFNRYHDLTIALLTGLMLGSLRKIWPWKVTIESITDPHGAELPVVEQNILPALRTEGIFNVEIVYGLLLAITGMIAVVVLDRISEEGSDAS